MKEQDLWKIRFFWWLVGIVCGIIVSFIIFIITYFGCLK